MQKGLIFTKPVSQIDFDDVEAFCQQRMAEGQHLDYKLSLTDNEKLAQTIASFANAHGGVILVGVEDDNKENKPVLPVAGMSFDRDIEGRIMSVVLTRIFPAVFCDIAVVPHQDGNKCVAVIRIPESVETPHTVNGKTGIFIRTGNRKNLYEERAGIEEIEWLLNKRKNAIDLRGKLTESAITRSENVFKIKCREAKELAEKESRQLADLGTAGNGLIEITPVYPYRAFLSSIELCQLLPELHVHDYFGTYDGGFPPHTHQNVVSQFGCYTAGFPGCYWYTELSNYGLFLHREGSYEKRDKFEGIWFARIVSRIEQSLSVVAMFYAKIGYWGNLRFRFNLSDLYEKKFLSIRGDNAWFFDRPAPVSPDDKCNVERVFTFAELKDNKQDLLLGIVQEIAWSFGEKINLDTVQNYLKKNQRWIENGAT